MIFQYILELGAMGLVNINTASLIPVFGLIGEIALWISALLTVISGVVYIVQNFEFIKNAK